jgi:proline iminopeptidase
MPAARAWSRYENTCSTLLPKAEGAVGGGVDRAALSLARIEAHYFRHDMFVDEDFLLDNVGELRKIPAVIIQGRYDIVCPAVTADELARAWPEAEYVIVSDAGHSAMEPGIRSALVGATEKFKTLR